MQFDNEIERDNFFAHIEDILSPIVIDPKQKPLKL
jgi:hypothetical protein